MLPAKQMQPLIEVAGSHQMNTPNISRKCPIENVHRLDAANMVQCVRQKHLIINYCVI